MSEGDSRYDWHNGLPHPRWTDLFHEIANQPPGEQEHAIVTTATRWLTDLAAAVSTEAGVVSIDDMRCMYTADPEAAEKIANWSRKALARIIAVVGEHRTSEMVGPRIVLLFDEDARYYDYIDWYYPDEGEFGTSSGICVHADYCHVVAGRGDTGTRHRVLAHEFTHLALAPLPLPAWLNEGIAQLMEHKIIGWTHFNVTRESVERHRQLWDQETLAPFWNGEAFHRPDEMSELAYHLAEILTRNILSRRDVPFPDFLAGAEWRDAGEKAARDVLGVDLASLAAEFLGPGHWEVPDCNDEQ